MKLNWLVRRATLACATTLLLVAASSCSSSTEGPTIEIRDGSWSAVPPTLAQAEESFRITVVNMGDEQQEFVVVQIFAGAPEALPVRNGVLDVGRSGSTFGVAYPSDEFGEGGTGFEPATIEPGETQSVTIGSSLKGGGGPGIYVVLSHLPGRYERGEYAVFTLTGPGGELPEPIVVEPEPTERLEIGESLPEWGGPLHGGGEFDSEVLRGRPALILVWWDGQPDAREALELFQSVVANRQDQVGFVVVDTFDVVDPERLVQLLSEVDVTAPLVIDDTADLEQVFKVGTEVPYWVVTNDTGVVVGVEYGMSSRERLIEMLNAASA